MASCRQSALWGRTETELVPFVAFCFTLRARLGPCTAGTQVCVLTAGEVIRILDRKKIEGQLRVKFDRGWTSISARDGTKLLELVTSE